MTLDSRSRAQWREAFEQCQAHARKLRREFETAKAGAWREGYERALLDQREAQFDPCGPSRNPYEKTLRDGCTAEHSPASNTQCDMAPLDVVVPPASRTSSGDGEPS